jgi:hypothetical protein
VVLTLKSLHSTGVVGQVVQIVRRPPKLSTNLIENTIALRERKNVQNILSTSDQCDQRIIHSMSLSNLKDIRQYFETMN